MNIGQWVILTNNDGSYVAAKPNTRIAYRVPIAQLIDTYINNLHTALHNIIKNYEAKPVDELLDSPEMMELIRAMPDSDVIPGTLPPNECRMHHRRLILAAFNLVHNLRITEEEISSWFLLA